MSDFFKIVSCIRKKRIEISYVPHLWEKDGVLSWPRSNLSNLRKDPSSKPEVDWQKFKAKVKKTNILDLDSAQLWEQNFVDAGTDAENDSYVCKTTRKSPRKSPLKKALMKNPEVTILDAHFSKIDVTEKVDSNQPADEISYYSKNLSPESSFSENFSRESIGNTEENRYKKNIFGNQCTATESGVHILRLKEQPFFSSTGIPLEDNVGQNLNEKYDYIKEMLEVIQKTQQDIIENQKTMYEKLEQFEARLKEFGVVNKATVQQIYTILKKEEKQIKQNEVDVISKFDFPLKSVVDVFKFNDDLRGEDFFNLMVKNYESVGGSTGEEEGRIVARKVRNLLFSEKVLTEFSWTGISRTTGIEKKQSFQKCENILHFFLKLVGKADSRWSVTKNEKFFKFVTLKHAKQMEKASIKKLEKSKKSVIADNAEVDGGDGEESQGDTNKANLQDSVEQDQHEDVSRESSSD